MATTESVKIESLDLSVESLFKDFYTVPDFQREYVWQRAQVEKLLQDVQDEFYNDERQLIEDREYFLGSIVVCKGPDDAFQLIDGQQRMTTIFLILCAIRDVLRDLKDAPIEPLNRQLSDMAVNEEGDTVARHRLELLYDDSRGVLKTIVEKPEEVERLKDKTISVLRIRAAYQDIKEFLVVNFDGKPKNLRKFYAAFTKRVKLIRIKTPSLTNALKVFETINDRGVGLDAMDLLKNLLFMKTDGKDYGKLKDRWKKLVNTLDGCHEKPLRFLRYFIMSHYEVDAHRPPREDDIYEWFVKNAKKCGLEAKPMAFLEVLITCAEAWANFAISRDPSGRPNPYLKNLMYVSGAARQHYILLLAGRHLEPELFSDLCRSIENLFFCYIITREPTKMFERSFASWAKELREASDAKALGRFVKERLEKDMAAHSDRFDFAFTELAQSKMQQYRIKYILARLTQHIEQQAWGNPADESADKYLDSSVNIEHILPQTPTAKVRAAFDKPEQYDEYVERLGNLTLLENTINTSVSNGAFDQKTPGYKQSCFLLTKALAEKPQVGVDTRLNRAVKELLSFKVWDSTSIEDRQKMLAKLARHVWGMPIKG